MDEVAKVREKIDIVALISEYLSLKKAGRNFKTNCPFHNEKTPSFIISPERQIWHCFGCQKGGDCFTFLMDYENLEFIEALRILAKKAGIELSESVFTKTETSKKEKIYNLNRVASEFYHYILTKHPVGKMALSYLLKTRKIDQRLIETFKIGFSSREGRALSNYLVNKKKYSKQDIIDAGISFAREGRVVDFFRSRIMFPLFDQRDNIMGFSGRIIDDKGEISKYVNTKDTPVYHKGTVFFGLNMAKDEIKKTGQAVIVEGEFDVISCFSIGIKNVIALKGTALTEDQATLISRFAQKVTLCLDQDEAGFEAIVRSLPSLEKKGLTTTVILLGEFKDPDDAIKKDPVFFKKAVKNDVGVYDFLIDSFLKKFGNTTSEGKKKIGDSILPLIGGIENQIVKEHYLKILSNTLDTSFENLMLEMEKILKKETSKKTAISAKTARDRTEILEEYLLSLILQSEDVKKSYESSDKILSDYNFKLPSHRKIYDNLSNYFAKYEEFNGKIFSEFIPKEIIPIFDTCFLFPIPKFEEPEKFERELKSVARELRLTFLKNKIKDTNLNLKTKSKEKDGEVIEKLQRELSDLISLLSKS
ncbi:MAG: DNA primase [Candidatus Levybacteria bacterium]|nr:DNA primase [Candidatus Levybacteria bacterium]